ncbi:hypothetical protein [Compostibacter hankyongensis]|uniref:RHS repeat protein n=1 Tax=Compostibacter hankyongensis TaxID=1007089 RepID=A0ABP8G678_9BACT
MKAAFTLLLMLVTAGLASAQYYYQDIYGNRQVREEQQRFAQDKVRRQELRSFDAAGGIDQDFRIEKTFSADYRTTRSTTRSLQSGSSVLVTLFDTAGKVIRSTDSSASSINISSYTYDSSGHLIRLSFVSRSDSTKEVPGFSEEREYTYSPTGQLQQMVRRKDGRIRSTVYFRTDGEGRVIEEQEKSAGSPVFHYQWNSAGALTDIYRYNTARKRMLPDFTFDYDSEGRLKEMLAVDAYSGDYSRWTYEYNEKGLLSGSTCYGKKNVLKGRIIYRYTF